MAFKPYQPHGTQPTKLYYYESQPLLLFYSTASNPPALGFSIQTSWQDNYPGYFLFASQRLGDAFYEALCKLAWPTPEHTSCFRLSR